MVELRQVHRLACSRRGSATPPRPRTTSASATCRRSPATTRTSRRCCAPSTAAWTGCSSWARTRPSAPSTRGSSAGRWRTSAGSWCATWPRSRARRSGATGPRCAAASCARRTSGPRSSSCPPPRTSRRRAPSRTPSACCSGATRRSTRRATAARSCGSCTTSSSACGRTTPGRERDRDWPILNVTWDYAEHGPHAEPSAEEVLQEINGRDLATGELVPELRGAQGRRQHGVRGVDLLRRVQGRRQPGAPADARRPARARRVGVARVGVGVAAEPPHPLQPRERRPGGQAVVGAQALRLVGRGAGRLDRLRRPRLPRRQAAVLPRRGRRDGDGRDLRRRAVHDAARRPRLALRPRRARGRPAADALRALRVAGPEPALPRPRVEPGDAAVGAAREPEGPHRRPALPRAWRRPSG